LSHLEVTFNRSKPPVDNLMVRQALAYAVDKKGIVNTVLFGQGVVNSQIFPPGYYAYDPSIPADRYPYNVQKAKQLLSEAGFPNGFTMDLENFAAIGVKVNLKDTLSVNANTVYTKQQCCQATTGRWLGRPSPLQTLGSKYAPGGANNTGDAQPPQAFLDAYTEAARATTAAEVQTAIRAAVKQTVEAEFDLYIAQPNAILAVNKKVKGLTLGYDGYADVSKAFYTVG
jgi:ABC-type transport system substrate-binding protein